MKSGSFPYRLCALLMAAIAVAAQSGKADSPNSWTGQAGTDWTTGSNWSFNAAPTSTDLVIVNTGSGNMPVLDAATGSTANITIGSTTAGNTLTIQDGGTLVSTGQAVIGDQPAGSGTVTVSGAGSQWNVAGPLIVGNRGTGALNLVGSGSVNIGGGTGTLTLGANSGATGTLNIGNGTTGGTLSASEVSGGMGTSVVNFGETGSYTFASVLAGFVSVNQTGAGTTVLTGSNFYFGNTTVTSGTLEAAATGALGQRLVTVDDTLDGNATLVVDGGVALSNSGIALANGGSLVNSGTVGLVTVSGGGGSITNNAAGTIVGHTGFGGNGPAVNVGALTTTNINNSGTITASGTFNTIITGSGATTFITNNAGVISSTGTASLATIFLTSGSIHNFGGLISEIGDGGSGVSLNGRGATVTNMGTSAQITASGAGAAAVNLAGSGEKVTNSLGGQILATGANGAGVVFGNLASMIPTVQSATLINQAGSLISSTGANGIGVAGAAVLLDTVLNSGTIFGAADGVAMAAGGTVTNNAGGIISSGTQAQTAYPVNAGGVVISGAAGTVHNSGQILSSGTFNAVELDAGGSVTNNSGGSISGGNDGIYTSTVAVTVSNSGTILGQQTAVLMAGGGVVSNTTGGYISSTSQTGVEMQFASGTVTNSGTIDGGFAGVQLLEGGVVTNNAGDSILGGTRGVVTAGTSATVTNSGTINGGGVGVIIENGGLLTNNAGGTIEDTLQAGAFVTSGTVNNSGTIIGDTGLFLGGASVVVNNAGGVITSTNGSGSGSGVANATGPTTLTNAGTINGGVQLLSGTSNIVTLESGGVIAGDLNEGSDSTSQLILDGAGTQAYSAAVTGSTTFSGTLIKNGTGAWTMDTAMQYGGGSVLNAGTLRTSNAAALGTGSVTVNAGAILAPLGGLKIGMGGVAPANLTIDGGTLQFTLTTTSTISELVNVTGTWSGSAVTVSLTGASVTAGVDYSLVKFSTNTLSLTDITLSNSIAGFSATDGFIGHTFYVLFSATGGGGGGGLIWNPNGGGAVNVGADYVGNGFTTTWTPTQNNTVNSLTYNTTSGSSSLTVYNTLTLTSGSFTVESGTATVQGGNAGANILTPGDFTKAGQGALVIDPMVLNVGANANISAGALDIQQSQMLVVGNVNVSGGAALNIQQGGSLAAGGSANVSGTFNVQTGGTAAIAGALNISAGGVTTVSGGGLLAAGGPANVNGVFNVQGMAAAAGGLNIGSGGITTVSSGGVFAAGSSASVNGLFDVQSGGAAAIAGSTSVNGGGVLTVDGALTSQQGVLVAQSGLVNGSGVITGNVTNNGTVLPGDDPATLTVAGNYTQSSAGTLNIEVAGLNNYGVLVVSGAANVGGTLLVTPFNNFKFAYGQEIPNFLVASSASGTFGTVTVDDPGYRGRVVQNGGDLSLLIAPSSYTAVAKNPNQYNVAKALNGFIPATSGDRAVVSTALDFLTASQYPSAFNAIMPDFYQTLTSMSLSLATTEGQIVDQRLSAIRMGSSGFAMQGVGNMPVYNEKGGDGKSTMDGKKDIISPAQDNHWGVWVQGNGIFGHSYSISDVPNYKFESGGFLVGGDYRWNENFSTGLFTGYQGAYGNYSNGGKVWMNGADFGVYATYDSKNGFYANAILMGAYSNYQVDRPVQFSTVNRMANSTPGGGDFGAFLEAGYDFKTSGFTYGPLANAQYTYLGVAPFTERNAGSLDLSMGSENLNSLQTNFGGHVAYTFILPNKYEIIPDLRMFWNHEFLQNPTGTQASLNGGGGPGFTYDTTAPSRDSVFAGVGVNAQLGNRWNVGAYYNIDFGGYTSITHMVSANLGFSW